MVWCVPKSNCWFMFLKSQQNQLTYTKPQLYNMQQYTTYHNIQRTPFTVQNRKHSTHGYSPCGGGSPHWCLDSLAAVTTTQRCLASCSVSSSANGTSRCRRWRRAFCSSTSHCWSAEVLAIATVVVQKMGGQCLSIACSERLQVAFGPPRPHVASAATCLQFSPPFALEGTEVNLESTWILVAKDFESTILDDFLLVA